jgi:hypothetical protein
MDYVKVSKSKMESVVHKFNATPIITDMTPCQSHISYRVGDNTIATKRTNSQAHLCEYHVKREYLVQVTF